MKLNDHPDTGSLYIARSFNPSADGNEVAGGVVLDSETDGRLIGIGIDNASHKPDLQEPTTARISVQANAAWIFT